MSRVDPPFKLMVYGYVENIPRGRVMTYGQIAALCGKPRAARIVGGIAHQAPCTNLPACGTIHMTPGEVCPAHELPWHRVVKKDGRLAEGYPGGTEGHKKALESEGVQFDNDCKIIDFNTLVWQLE